MNLFGPDLQPQGPAPVMLLLVEDDPGLAALFAGALEQTGLKVHCVQTGGEALDWAAAHPESLILLDYSLPDMKASEVVARLKESGLAPPFIVITGQGDERIAVEMMKQGAEDYLTKDLSIEDRLPQAVSRVLGRIETRRQLAEAHRNERRRELELSAIYEQVPSPLFVVDGQLRLRKCNRAFARMLSRPAGELAGLKLCDAFGCLPEPQVQGLCAACKLRQCVASTLETGATHTQVEGRLCCDPAQPLAARSFLIATTPLETDSGGCVLASLEDITARKRSEEVMRASLEEKTVLLREVHHRVKNNLQIVSSLLNLHAARVDNPALLRSLEDTRSRVRSMALLHEALYRSDNLARLDVTGYIETLCVHLFRASGPDIVSRVFLERRLAPVRLTVDQAVPCGLIVNELVSNALKHAFAGGRSGRVTVTLRPEEPGQVLLTVEDNGAGLPAGREEAPRRTLGLQLARGLAGQLGGVLESEARGGPEGGALFRLVFPNEPQESPEAFAGSLPIAGV